MMGTINILVAKPVFSCYIMNWLIGLTAHSSLVFSVMLYSDVCISLHSMWSSIRCKTWENCIPHKTILHWFITKCAAVFELITNIGQLKQTHCHDKMKSVLIGQSQIRLTLAYLQSTLLNSHFLTYIFFPLWLRYLQQIYA